MFCSSEDRISLFCINGNFGTLEHNKIALQSDNNAIFSMNYIFHVLSQPLSASKEFVLPMHFSW